MISLWTNSYYLTISVPQNPSEFPSASVSKFQGQHFFGGAYSQCSWIPFALVVSSVHENIMSFAPTSTENSQQTRPSAVHDCLSLPLVVFGSHVYHVTTHHVKVKTTDTKHDLHVFTFPSPRLFPSSLPSLRIVLISPFLPLFPSPFTRYSHYFPSSSFLLLPPLPLYSPLCPIPRLSFLF